MQGIPTMRSVDPLNTAWAREKSGEGMGEARAPTRGGICFSNQLEFIIATFLFRVLDTVSPRETISLSQSRQPHKSEMKRRARWKLGKMD